MEEKLNLPIDIFNSWAPEYQEKFMDVSLYHESFDLLCEMIRNKNADILDVGCGPGNISRYLISKMPECKILGIDLAPNMIELAKTNNPTADFKVMDGTKISQINQSFDAIVLGFCLPYLSHSAFRKLIADCGEKIKPGGVLYISTMEQDNFNQSGVKTNSSGKKIFVEYYREEDLRNVLKFNNFSVKAIQRKTYVYNGSDVTDIILMAKHQSEHSSDLK